MHVIVVLGFLAGVAVAAPPVGPLSLLFYRHVMVRDLRAAAAVASVIAVADGVWTAVSAFGLAWLDAAPDGIVLGLRLAGVVLVAALGLRFALFPPSLDAEAPNGSRVTGALAQAAGIAALNPSALISWMIVVDIVRSLGGDAATTQERWLPLAVVAGVATWFAVVLTALRTRLQAPPPRLARAGVRVVGWAMVTTAVVYGWQVVRPGGFALAHAAPF